MSEPFIERLSQFTPDGGGLDRDALLYAAGRAAARPNRVWIALSLALASSQGLTLVLALPLWWSQPAAPSIVHVALPTIAESVSPPLPEPSNLNPSQEGSLWTARQNLLDINLEDRPFPVEAGPWIESEPSLRAFSSLPLSILN